MVSSKKNTIEKKSDPLDLVREDIKNLLGQNNQNRN